MGETLIAESAGLRITRFCARGTVDYPALLNALLPDLTFEAVEGFRRQPSQRVWVTVQAAADRAAIPFAAKRVARAAERAGEHATEHAGEPATATSFWF